MGNQPVAEIIELYNPIQDALEIVVGKRNVRKLLRQGRNMGISFFDSLDMGCFLVENGIIEFGSNDNRKSKRRS